MNRAKLLALSILAATTLWGSTAATQAASPAQGTEPQPQAGAAQTDSNPLVKGDESGESGVDEGNDDNELGNATEREQEGHGDVEDDDRSDQGNDENDDDEGDDD